MNEYVIYADSSCDTPDELLDKWGVKRIEHTFRFTDSPEIYNNSDMTPHEFYEELRAGRDAKTSAINPDIYKEYFEAELKEGRDVMYLSFSSGLSTTYNCARVAAAELAETYPDNKVVVADSLCASTGYGMMLRLMLDFIEAGHTLEEARDFVDGKKRHICSWFTVGDLNYLKRSGRVSGVAAFVGTALGIKPVLHMDDDGHLVSVSNVRGKKKAIASIVEAFGELVEDINEGPYYLCHSDCPEDAEALGAALHEAYGIEIELTGEIGPVIGSHCGPGTFAVFFIGKER